jgi:hypothetical protein
MAGSFQKRGKKNGSSTPFTLHSSTIPVLWDLQICGHPAISNSFFPQVNGSLGEGNFAPLLFKSFEDAVPQLVLDINPDGEEDRNGQPP